jgi:antitoxin PrlF
MQTTTSKLTKKYQATIPEPVRQLLHLQAGDAIAFDIVGDDIHLRKARPMDLAFVKSLEGTLSEWATQEDEEAYRDL